MILKKSSRLIAPVFNFSRENQMNISALKKAILDIVEKKAEKVMPVWIENQIAKNYKVNRKNIRKILKELIDEGELIYTYHFGSSYLEKSFNRPVRISERVVLKPANISFRGGHEDVVISIDHGASFGTGEHPTTRLSVRGIEILMTTTSLFSQKKDTLMLDIGTGSGVLALTALKFGVTHALAIDFDPCARDEARKNAGLNSLEKRFEIYEGDPAAINRPVDLVTANLRFPTLVNLSCRIDRLCDPAGCAVLSGVREDEFYELSEIYDRLGFLCHWKSFDQGWAGGAFIKNIRNCRCL
jgi:ribosomal protein L11 methyltransferase